MTLRCPEFGSNCTNPDCIRLATKTGVPECTRTLHEDAMVISRYDRSPTTLLPIIEVDAQLFRVHPHRVLVALLRWLKNLNSESL